MPDAQIVQEAEKIANEQQLNTYEKLDKKIIYGKKVVLFAFEPVDLEHFVRLHKEDAQGYMQDYCLKKMVHDEAMKFTAMLFLTKQIKCWSVYLKQNSFKNLMENRRAGFIYLTNFTSFSVNISGIMDSAIMKGLLKFIRRGTKTFAQDAIETLTQYIFDCGLERLETTVVIDNRRALALDKQCGFKEEGRLRKAFYDGSKFRDVIMLSILKEDWNKK